MNLPRPQLAGLLVSGLLATCTLALPPASPASTTPYGGGDDSIAWLWTDADQLDYTAADMLDFLEGNFPDEDFSELRDAVESGDVLITELLGGSSDPSSHDKTTIAVATKDYPLWVCALGVRHEWWHISHIPPGSGPEQQDPTTSEDDPCGSCNHLDGLLDQLKHIALLSCEELVPAQEACDIWKKAHDAAGKVFYDCVYEGSGCSSYGSQLFESVIAQDMRPCNCN